MCGIIGILSSEPINAELCQGMLQLQHRGQDASGLYLYSPVSQLHILRKEIGLVHQLFQKQDELEGEWGLGHVRYTTAGKGSLQDAQPHVQGPLALVHNGNLVNHLELRRDLQERGCVFQTDSDSESILHLLSASLARISHTLSSVGMQDGASDLFSPGRKHCQNDKESLEEDKDDVTDCADSPRECEKCGPESGSFDDICKAIESVYANAQGSYSVIALLEGVGLFAFRDPLGIRPLLFGTRGASHGFASEPPALSTLGFQNIRDLLPGEAVFVDRAGRVFQKRLLHKKSAHCSFEFNYFAKPHSLLEGKEIYRIRAKLGEHLARSIRKASLSIDAVVPIPESGNAAAIALARELSVPFEAGFIKMNHVGRTFLFPSQSQRQQAVCQKLFPVGSVFNNKSILLVDDSIIRGTVSRRSIALAREAGAKKVYIASTFPPVRHPCVYGIDFPHREDLVAFDKTIDEISDALGADGVIYNDLDALKDAIGIQEICTACMTGDYPTALSGIRELQNQRREDLLQIR